MVGKSKYHRHPPPTLSNRRHQCVDSRDYVVAQYTLKPPDKPAYNTSGNILTIDEPFVHLALGESVYRYVCLCIDAHTILSPFDRDTRSSYDHEASCC